MKVKSFSPVQLLASPWIAAYQAPPSMGFSRQEHQNGLPLPSLNNSKNNQINDNKENNNNKTQKGKSDSQNCHSVIFKILSSTTKNCIENIFQTTTNKNVLVEVQTLSLLAKDYFYSLLYFYIVRMVIFKLIYFN